jgi:uncharacterized protein YigA (DUF484 family)
MKPPEQPHLLATGDEDGVRQFLGTHPDFFVRNPELVERLMVPHPCGSAQSLIEHQVGLLRVRNRKLERQLEELLATARDNENLHKRVWALGIRLLESEDPQVMFDVLYHGLCRDFRADSVAVRVRVTGVIGAPRAEFVADIEPGLDNVEEDLARVLSIEQAQCGTLDPDVCQVLFGWPGGGSGVLVPIQVQGRGGILGIASRDANRFHDGMGTTYIEQLGGMLALALKRLLE